jgi:hypothetical protein
MESDGQRTGHDSPGEFQGGKPQVRPYFGENDLGRDEEDGVADAVVRVEEVELVALEVELRSAHVRCTKPHTTRQLTSSCIPEA